jgi:hypothetical protein
MQGDKVMMALLSAQLKPCPFCGGEMEYDIAPPHNNRPTTLHALHCLHCDLHINVTTRLAMGQTSEDIVAWWNSRPIEEALKTYGDNMKDLCNLAVSQSQWAGQRADKWFEIVGELHGLLDDILATDQAAGASWIDNGSGEWERITKRVQQIGTEIGYESERNDGANDE